MMHQKSEDIDIENWQQLMHDFSFSENRDSFEGIIKAYEEKHRAYHNVNHLLDCLNKLNDFGLIEKRKEIQLAFYFHDIIYDSFAKNNEKKSAEAAKEFLEKQNASSQIIELVFDLIIATEYKVPPKNEAQKIMMDIDISILGSSSKNYSLYTEKIRKEYKWVPSFLYKKKRKEILIKFIEQPRLFFTEKCFSLYEKQARENIHKEILDLS